jgi:predicted nucleic acid-binding protein
MMMNATNGPGRNLGPRFRVLLDTNVIAYFYDPRDPVKQAMARQILPILQENKQACLSVQVLAEFGHLAPRKLAMSQQNVFQQITSLIQAWHAYDLTGAIVAEAARGVRDHSLAYYDAQIWATARLNQIPVIFSEDFNSGSSLEGIRFVNPFAAAFKLDDWV